ncbi:M20/M25/M40 family metallo-hydrolase [Candidatus Saccharibacteria bacterium]|nr:M20/M25/M40 family metallo-hydrolase [Candidatus Saccharibacteria bacterium]
MDILKLSKELIATKSANACLKKCEKAIEAANIEHFERSNVKGILASNRPSGTRKFKIILNGHLDIVAGKPNQFKPVIKGDKLYGRGATDMKAGVACLIDVFNEVQGKVNFPLALQLVTDEEVGGFNGTLAQVDAGVRADFVIAGESTDFDLVNRARGVLQARIDFTGKSAHGAYPARGNNAVLQATRFLADLEKLYPLPKTDQYITTFNAAKIGTSNQTTNKIPSDAFLVLDIRYIAGDLDKFKANLNKIMPSKSKLTILEEVPSVNTPLTNPYLKKLASATSRALGQPPTSRGALGASDLAHYQKVNVPGVEFGPIGSGAHGDTEYVEISSLDNYASILKDFLLSI